MIFHENRLLADDSHEISCLIFFEKMLQNLSSAAVVIGALRVMPNSQFLIAEPNLFSQPEHTVILWASARFCY